MGDDGRAARLRGVEGNEQVDSDCQVFISLCVFVCNIRSNVDRMAAYRVRGSSTTMGGRGCLYPTRRQMVASSECAASIPLFRICDDCDDDDEKDFFFLSRVL